MPATPHVALKSSTRRKRELGLSDEAVLILCSLSREPIDQDVLAESSAVSIHVVRRVLRKFYGLGWVGRSEGSDDLRRKLFALTKEGQAIIDSLACPEVSIPARRS